MNDFSEDRPSKQEELAESSSISIRRVKEGVSRLRNEDGSLTFVYAENNYLEYKVDDWEKFLSENFSGFRGNLRNATTLLSDFAWGVRKTCHDKSMSETLPLAIVNSEEVIDTPFVSNDEYGFLIRLSQLENDSLDVDSFIAIQRITGEVIFEGSRLDFYKLLGAEESHHYWFRRENKGHVYLAGKPTDISVVEYDSREIEFQALKWLLDIAISESMQDSTIRLLLNRYRDAKEYRERKEDK